MRLSYVIDTTEQAANKTMDAVEASMPMAESMLETANKLSVQWTKVMQRDIELQEFKTLCHDIDGFFKESSGDLDKLSALLTDVLMAQGFQDLRQVIRRVIELVTEVQDSLVNMLTMFGNMSGQHATTLQQESPPELTGNTSPDVEGPIVDAEQRNDVVNNQDDVDDLLSSLGF